MEFTIENGVLIECTGTDSQVTIPEGVREIGGHNTVFHCPNLVRIDLPSSLTTIHGIGFSGLGIDRVKEVNVPSLDVLLRIENHAGLPFGAKLLIDNSPIRSAIIP